MDRTAVCGVGHGTAQQRSVRQEVREGAKNVDRAAADEALVFTVLWMSESLVCATRIAVH